jgi:hypothetical protein
MSPVIYELGFYIPEDGIVHSHENLKFYIIRDIAEFRMFRNSVLQHPIAQFRCVL